MSKKVIFGIVIGILLSTNLFVETLDSVEGFNTNDYTSHQMIGFIMVGIGYGISLIAIRMFGNKNPQSEYTDYLGYVVQLFLIAWLVYNIIGLIILMNNPEFMHSHFHAQQISNPESSTEVLKSLDNYNSSIFTKVWVHTKMILPLGILFIVLLPIYQLFISIKQKQK